MPRMKKRRSLSTNVTPEEYEIVRDAAQSRGQTISRFLLDILTLYLRYDFGERERWGGDRASFKTPETHARVCGNMRAARAERRKANKENKEEDGK